MPDWRLCRPCRQWLQALADGSLREGVQPVLSMPGAPLWVHTRPDRLVAMFSVHMQDSPDDPLMSAFIQVRPSSAYPVLQHKQHC